MYLGLNYEVVRENVIYLQWSYLSEDPSVMRNEFEYSVNLKLGNVWKAFFIELKELVRQRFVLVEYLRYFCKRIRELLITTLFHYKIALQRSTLI